MKIGATSNMIFNSMSTGLKYNNHSGKGMSPLEKQKFQLQEQMKKIEESKSSKESKENSIKELQEKLEEVEAQLAKEKLEKSTEKTKVENEKDKEIEEQRAAEESKENSQVINKNVMIGITSASSHQKIGKVAYSVYRQAEAKGDMEVAQRALRYTSSEIKKSAQSKKLIERGIKEYKKQMDNVKKGDTKKVITDKIIKENSVMDMKVDSTTVEEHSRDTSKIAPNSEIKVQSSEDTSNIVANTQIKTEPSVKEALK
ncbi:hypothetical protein RBU49_00200 [Clostridium sp. MB40-C1]|uniref:hypothetical protein n=1 Tax=Clostridium sp. MB40-C1 TaxID=3070996 RepID=UPI0027E12D64|nr:hypothetical protein [Clostridium sp. MB40-C1]WMJ80700.1 hypothetical protein RBU49_00200 [Clostridium sp. MB40-C1]